MGKPPPTPQWLAQYENVKHLLTPAVPYGEVFGQSEACGRRLHYIDMGEVCFPTGKIAAFDPAAFPDRLQPYCQTVPTGTFGITAMVADFGGDDYAIAAVRVQFDDSRPVVHYAALTGQEDLDGIQADGYFGFATDTGLATIMDMQTFQAYAAFEQAALAQDEYFNLYDNLLEEELEKSHAAQPALQSDDGDWANFTLPGSGLSVPVFRSGQGDGVYPVYFGYGADGRICDVVIEFIPPDGAD
ncbi:DUF4241 domain-containing protein [Kingella potus]|uniref:DUF4241 domain-containing protein n=1 Tax=Kingella potus TaxID=265175 RepID=UPI001FD629C3|nr:DUF4241 domain-containing protein [Kingella potus]UOP00934.1 DUF4241 domain-containing protein [Kingella potus]